MLYNAKEALYIKDQSVHFVLSDRNLRRPQGQLTLALAV